jgi:hypothetical protein
MLSKLKMKDEYKGFHKDIDNDYNRMDLTTKNNIDHLKELEEDPIGTPKPNQPDNDVIVVTKAPTTT